MHIVVDGYNLIRQSDAFRRLERVSLEEGRRALLRSLSLYGRRTGHRVTVVFDAWESGSPLVERDRCGQVAVLYSRRGQTADDLIKEMVQNRREETVVVTSDRDIADFAFRRGATAVSSPEFEARLREASPGRGGGGPPSGREEAGEDREDVDPGRRKKGPSRRLSRKKRAIQSVFRKL